MFLEKTSGSFLQKSTLIRLKLRALRSGVWFRALRRIDRALIDLTLRVADRVRNPGLARALFAVIARLENALQEPVSRAINEVGFPLARWLSRIGSKWGNSSAREWANDFFFARFLAIMHLNGSCSAKR